MTSSGSQSANCKRGSMNGGVAALNRPVMGRHEIPVEDKILFVLHIGRHSSLSVCWHVDEFSAVTGLRLLVTSQLSGKHG